MQGWLGMSTLVTSPEGAWWWPSLRQAASLPGGWPDIDYLLASHPPQPSHPDTEYVMEFNLEASDVKMYSLPSNILVRSGGRDSNNHNAFYHQISLRFKHRRTEAQEA